MSGVSGCRERVANSLIGCAECRLASGSKLFLFYRRSSESRLGRFGWVGGLTAVSGSGHRVFCEALPSGPCHGVKGIKDQGRCAT